MDKPEGIFHCAEHGVPGSSLADKAWQATGEFRPPLEGEWFIINGVRRREACRAHEDYTVSQWIAVEWQPPT